MATTAGIFGEMIRDMMVRCVEKRFGTVGNSDGMLLPTPHRATKPTEVKHGARLSTRAISMVLSAAKIEPLSESH